MRRVSPVLARPSLGHKVGGTAETWMALCCGSNALRLPGDRRVALCSCLPACACPQPPAAGGGAPGPPPWRGRVVLSSPVVRGSAGQAEGTGWCRLHRSHLREHFPFRLNSQTRLLNQVSCLSHIYLLGRRMNSGSSIGLWTGFKNRQDRAGH